MFVPRVAGIAAVVTAALTTTVAATAAGLGIAPARLTTASAASSVSASTCSLAASSADAYVDGALLAVGSNFGSSTDLWVRSSLLGNRRSFARFDLAGCGIPSAARVTNATLALVMSQGPGSNRTYEVSRVTAPWLESAVTWAGQPAVAGTPTATAATGTADEVTLSWTVTTDVQAFVAGTATNHGWRISDSSEGALVSVDAIFGSRERAAAGERPSLDVTYYP